jgi:copper chaperone CopZ
MKAMEKRTFQVPNIGCDGCVQTIESAVSEITGVQSVKGARASKQVTVEYGEPATWAAIKDALIEVDYAPAEA